MQASFFGANARSANRFSAERRTLVVFVSYVRAKIKVGVGVWHFAFETQIAVIVIIVNGGGVAYLVVLAHKPLFAVVLVRYYFAILGDFRNIAVCVVGEYKNSALSRLGKRAERNLTKTIAVALGFYKIL